MMEWIQIVLCPKCKVKKEISLTQRRWKCPECKQKHEVADTLWRRMRKDSDSHDT